MAPELRYDASMRKAGASVLVTLFAAACGVGDDTTSGVSTGIECSAVFTTTGTFTQAATPARPTDPAAENYVSGCWPAGTWEFTAAIEEAGEVPDADGDGVGDRCTGAQAPKLAAKYSFVITRTEDDLGWKDTSQYTGDTQLHQLYKIKVSEGGSGDCEGSLQLYSADFKQWWNFKPNLAIEVGQSSAQLTGQGDFTQYIQPVPPTDDEDTL